MDAAACHIYVSYRRVAPVATSQFRLQAVYVRHAVDSPAVRGACRKNRVTILPQGFPFLVSAASGRVIEPVASFIAARFLVRQIAGRPTRLRNSPNTREATIRDLKDFYDFLDHVKVPIDSLTTDLLATYAGTMLGQTSPVTERPYAVATVSRRMATIRQFALWLQDEGRLKRRLELTETSQPHEGYSGQKRSRSVRGISTSSFPGMAEIDPTINVLTQQEASITLADLGPLPSGQHADTKPESRDRLMAELGLNVGLRRQEIVSLPLKVLEECLAAMDPRDHPFRMQILPVLGKGRKYRKVNVPTWLIKELKLYAAGERSAAIEAGQALYGSSFRQPKTIFVNRARAPRYRGLAVSPDALYASFRKSQRRLVAEGALSRTFRIHDLRHTYAVWTWIKLKRNGDHEPSKYVQSQLGHANRETTESIYLAAVSIYEPRLFDDFAVALNKIGNIK